MKSLFAISEKFEQQNLSLHCGSGGAFLANKVVHWVNCNAVP